MYGVLGMGEAPKSVIEASLNDIGTDTPFNIPWYGRVTPGLEVVYDWVLDNDVPFTLVSALGGKPAPKALTTSAIEVQTAQVVNQRIIEILTEANGMALILWDSHDEFGSAAMAADAIEAGLPTLELTNGMVPIIFDDSPLEPLVESPSVVEDAPEKEDMSFDRPTLENMPAAVVKRTAKEMGFNPKTRDEAISNILGEPTTTVEVGVKTITSVVITYSDGSSITL